MIMELTTKESEAFKNLRKKCKCKSNKQLLNRAFTALIEYEKAHDDGKIIAIVDEKAASRRELIIK